MNEIERGFRIIDNALKSGKFSKMQLEFIGQFCDSIKGATNKVLARIAAQNSGDSGAGEHDSQHTQPEKCPVCENGTRYVPFGTSEGIKCKWCNGTGIQQAGA